MAYVELHGEMPRHPKTSLVMRELKIPRAQAVGHLACLWAHMIDSSPSGILRRDIIEAAGEWEGEEGKLISALLKHRWLDPVDGETVRIHDVEDYTRQYRKARADYEKKKRVGSAEEAQKKRVLRAEEAVNGSEEKRTEVKRTDKDPCPEPVTAPAPGPTPCPPELVGLELYEKDERLHKAWPKVYAALKVACPGVDIIAEVKKLHLWEVANPSRRKVNRAKFLSNNISRKQDEPKMFSNNHAQTAKATATAAPSEWTLEKGGRREF